MEYRKAIGIILNMKKKYSLNKQEEEALSAAIGTLDWFALGKNRLKKIFEKRKKPLSN